MAIDDQTSRVATLKAAGASLSQVATELGISKDAAFRRWKKASANALVTKMASAPEITIQGDVMVVGDIHVPYTIKPLVELVKAAGERFGIKQVAIVGDLFSFSGMSSYPTVVREPTVSDEFRAAREILSYWGSQFQQFYMCMGNHDIRLTGAAKGELGPDNLADMFRPADMNPDRIVMTPRDRIWWGKGKNKWLLAHQRQYSRNKLTVAMKLASIHDCNVLTHHQHHQAIGVSENGKYVVADNGCLCSSATTPYTALSTTTFPRWCVGFSMFVGGSYLPYWHDRPFGWKPSV